MAHLWKSWKHEPRDSWKSQSRKERSKDRAPIKITVRVSWPADYGQDLSALACRLLSQPVAKYRMLVTAHAGSGGADSAQTEFRCRAELSESLPLNPRPFSSARSPSPRTLPENPSRGRQRPGILGVVPLETKVREMAAALLGYTACRQLSQLLAAVAFFHGSEYALAISFHGRSNVSLSSLLISKQYAIAMACALLEYAVEITIFPELKEKWTLSNIGLVMVLIGELIRKAAVITAGRAFTHNIRIYHEEHHQLIRSSSWILWFFYMGNWHTGDAV
ncbi:hypothetical protein Taro_039787 [Colocasia esculenta]|uniref:Protein-S-isoprenylcysteine O-methyltransferase n=1 Tax=Colocasia esculenta TaxID=4460 RepID=A0A843WA71_COLES|nr:hypothetical protein [Colocasia esculenta]